LSKHLKSKVTIAAIGKSRRQVRKHHTVAASNNKDHAPQPLFAYASHFVQSFTS